MPVPATRAEKRSLILLRQGTLRPLCLDSRNRCLLKNYHSKLIGTVLLLHRTDICQEKMKYTPIICIMVLMLSCGNKNKTQDDSLDWEYLDSIHKVQE